MTPFFAHEDGGVFLGNHMGREFRGNGGRWDLYYLPAEEHCGGYPTIIARYGDDPADYSAGLDFGWNVKCIEMVEARKRAQAAGYNVMEEWFR